MTQSEQRLVSALRSLIQRAKAFQADPESDQKSKDLTTALFYGQRAADEVNLVCATCYVPHEDAEKMVGG